MKSFVVFAMFCLMTVSTMQAQKVESNAPQKMEQTKQIDALAEKLGLTVKQKANVSKTVIAFKNVEDRIQASDIPRAEKESKIAAVVVRMEKNLETYLTEEQFSKYKEIKSNQKKF